MIRNSMGDVQWGRAQVRYWRYQVIRKRHHKWQGRRRMRTDSKRKILQIKIDRAIAAHISIEAITGNLEVLSRKRTKINECFMCMKISLVGGSVESFANSTILLGVNYQARKNTSRSSFDSCLVKELRQTDCETVVKAILWNV